MTTESASTLEQARASAGQGSGGALGGSLIFITGFVASVSGIAMIHSRSFSWTLFRISRDLDQMGISKGELILAGLVLMSLGLLIKTVRSGARSFAAHMADTLAAPGGVDTFALERLEGGLTMLQKSLERLEHRLATLAEGQDEARSQLSKAGSPEADGSRIRQSDALFRLAASVDQLGFRVDESLTGLRKRLEGLSETLGERLVGAIDRMANDTLEHSSEVALASAEDEMSVLVTLEDEEAYSAGSQLGLLDKIDDFGNFGSDDPGAPALDLDRVSDTPAALPKRNLDQLLPDERVARAVRERRQRGG